MLTVLMATWNGAPTLPTVLEACCRCTERLPLQLVTQARRAKKVALNLAPQLIGQRVRDVYSGPLP